MSIATLVLAADEHLLTIIPGGDIYTWCAVCWQNAVEQVLVDCFGQCCHSLVGFVWFIVVDYSFFTFVRPAACAEFPLPCFLQSQTIPGH